VGEEVSEDPIFKQSDELMIEHETRENHPMSWESNWRFPSRIHIDIGIESGKDDDSEECSIT
jgi:hypothetical protein